MITDKIKTTTITATAIVLTALVLGMFFQNRNKNLDTISVVGLGTKDFVSDEILWTANFTTTQLDIKAAYSKIINDQKVVSDFFISKGFSNSEFIFGAVNFQKKFSEVRTETDNGTKYEQVFNGYEATQTISFTAKKNTALMARIEEVSNKTSELVNSGIELTSNTVQYTYSELPNLKHSLIESATKDASERAKKIVLKANGDLGKLKNASMGVFQITGQGSTEEDSYGGINDIYSKNKTARITVRLEYELD